MDCSDRPLISLPLASSGLEALERFLAIAIQYRPASGQPRKVSFRPRSDGGWFRIMLEWNGCQWRETGCEVVEDVALECADGVAIGE